MTHECYRFIVSGRVQGVYFRQSAAAQARQLALAGWVCNRDDGAVEGLVAGTATALDAFKNWLQQGPPAARVDDLQWQLEATQPTMGFEVRR